jgi:NADPH:quinone reductase-like Zn-dependent oxidoreductase
MQKAIFNQYGDLDSIQIIDTEIPQPSRGEVLIKVQAVGLNPKDVLVRKGKFRRFSGKQFPQTIGFEFSGFIEDPNGSRYAQGDRVFGMINGWKGHCCAEFITMPLSEIAPTPEGYSHTELAGIALAGQTALQALRDIGGLEAGKSVCINGASGGVGTLAIQIAKALGASVTIVSSKKNTELCLSLGADTAIAYDEENILESGRSFDVFFDVFGNQGFKKTTHLLKAKGIYISTVPKPEVLKAQILNVFRGKKARLIIVKSKTEDIRWLGDRIAEKRIRPVVDKVFSLGEMKEAQRYIESKRARGKVVIEF